MSVIDLRTNPPRHERLELVPRHAPTSQPSTYGAILNLFAVSGAVLLAVLAISATAHLSLVVFRSDSMAPAYPTGTVVLVRSVPASQVRIGDVVTVDRPGFLPITHRVVSATTGDDGVTTLTLRGDANPTTDPAPYRTTEVRRVEVALPGVRDAMTIVGALGLAVGALTLGVVALVARRRPRVESCPRPSPGRSPRPSRST